MDPHAHGALNDPGDIAPEMSDVSDTMLLDDLFSFPTDFFTGVRDNGELAHFLTVTEPDFDGVSTAPFAEPHLQGVSVDASPRSNKRKKASSARDSDGSGGHGGSGGVSASGGSSNRRKKISGDETSTDAGDATKPGSIEGTQDEQRRQQQIIDDRRARNRRHARETRRRKKQSFHDMKEELEALRLAKARWERACASASAPHGAGLSLRTFRRRATVNSVLRLRSLASTDAESWSEHVAPDVTLVLPLAPYRYQAPVNANTQLHSLTLCGVQALIHDSRGLAVSIGALCGRGLHHNRCCKRPPQPPSVPPHVPQLVLERSPPDSPAHEWPEPAATPTSGANPTPADFMSTAVTLSPSTPATVFDSSLAKAKSSSAAKAEQTSNEIESPAVSELVEVEALAVDEAHLWPCGVHMEYVVCEQSVHRNERGFLFPFEMRTTNLVDLGLRCELSKQGTLLVNFDSNDKIVQLELAYDTIGFWRQMQHCRGHMGPLRFIPTTLADALHDSGQARAILDSAPPNHISFVNDSWQALFGHSDVTAKGKSMRLLQSLNTDIAAMDSFLADCACVRHGVPCPSSMENIVRCADGSELKVFMQVTALVPVDEPSQAASATHLLVIAERSDFTRGDSSEERGEGTSPM